MLELNFIAYFEFRGNRMVVFIDLGYQEIASYFIEAL